MKIFAALIVVFVVAFLVNRADRELDTELKDKGMARHIHRLAYMLYGGMLAALATYLQS